MLKECLKEILATISATTHVFVTMNRRGQSIPITHASLEAKTPWMKSFKSAKLIKI